MCLMARKQTTSRSWICVFYKAFCLKKTNTQRAHSQNIPTNGFKNTLDHSSLRHCLKCVGFRWPQLPPNTQPTNRVTLHIHWNIEIFTQNKTCRNHVAQLKHAPTRIFPQFPTNTTSFLKESHARTSNKIHQCEINKIYFTLGRCFLATHHHKSLAKFCSW